MARGSSLLAFLLTLCLSWPAFAGEPTQARSSTREQVRQTVQRAIEFLIASQTPEGSWPMVSRSTPNGEPGSAKLLTPITCAASSWAVFGLSRQTPQR